MGLADATAYLRRLVRLDPAAPVRLEPAGEGTVLWAPLPWEVLVTRRVAVALPAGLVPARDLLEAVEGQRDPRVDADVVTGWRWGLPPGPGEAIEQVPAAELRRIDAAAAQTLRDVAEHGVAGRAVGQRAVRDALLDHVPVTVEDGPRRVRVPQRLVQGLVRMDFVDQQPSVEDTVAVRVSGGWIGLAGTYGTAWWRRVSRLTLTPLR
jgi:hypothetical protein